MSSSRSHTSADLFTHSSDRKAAGRDGSAVGEAVPPEPELGTKEGKQMDVPDDKKQVETVPMDVVPQAGITFMEKI